MKKKMKWLKYVIISIVVLIYMAIYGNPVSHFLTVRTVNKILDEKYPGYEIEKVRTGVILAFGDGMYALVKNPESPDSKFYIRTDDLGRYKSDTYNEDVMTTFNTRHRLTEQYRTVVNDIMEKYPEENKKWKPYGSLNTNSAEDDIFIRDKEYTKEEIYRLSLKYGDISMITNEKLSDDEFKDAAVKMKNILSENDMGAWQIRVHAKNGYKNYEWYLL